MEWAADLKSLFQGMPEAHLALAVSGGSDSMALLHLVHSLCTDSVQGVTVLSVDHQLRPESADECAAVAETCAGLGLPHVTLRWENGWDGTGNLQDAARRARYGLMTDWVKANGADGLVLGHTADDQAETVLLRMARKSGVDGLSAMGAKSMAYGVTLYRPLLGVRRQTLRDYLTERGIGWADDPGNEDPKYDRIKMRQAVSVLEPLGITVESLGDLAAVMGETRKALDVQTAQAAAHICNGNSGDLSFNAKGFEALPEAIKRRLLIKAIGWFGQAAYSPRRDAVNRVLRAIEVGRKETLSGCVIRPTARGIRLYRELNALKNTTSPLNAAWDGRWWVEGTEAPGTHVKALGIAGVQSLSDWRDSGLTLEQAAVHPGVWQGERLIAAPTLQQSHGFTAKPLQSTEDFISSLLSR